MGEEMTGRTLLVVVVWHCPITIESDADLTSLLRLELFTVGFDSVCVSEDKVVANTANKDVSIETSRAEGGQAGCEDVPDQSRCNRAHHDTEMNKYETHIQGSVEESPSTERLRSLERPGANTPRP